MNQDPEVIVNLWYIVDPSGLLISLKGRAYVMAGSDEQKLKLLNERALLDFMIAEDFPLPTWVKTTIGKEQYNSAFFRDLVTMGQDVTLFEDCLKQLEIGISKTHEMKISLNPLVSMTPLLMDNDNKVKLLENMKKVKI